MCGACSSSSSCVEPCTESCQSRRHCFISLSVRVEGFVFALEGGQIRVFDLPYDLVGCAERGCQQDWPGQPALLPKLNDLVRNLHVLAELPVENLLAHPLPVHASLP